jgi:CubicO group peptidase (beta-lactamase class C family)
VCLSQAVLLLRDEGVLQLDDPVAKWLPELRAQQAGQLATADSHPPTLRELLSMNSGLPEDDPWADRLESMSDADFVRVSQAAGRMSNAAHVQPCVHAHAC